jgi:CrcB protein
MLWKQFFIIFIGGGLGSCFRYALSSFTNGIFNSTFPLGTLVVNLMGCFVAGCLAGLPMGIASLAPDLRTAIMIGFLGGFTTFSAYEYETLILLKENSQGSAWLNLVTGPLLGLLATVLGYTITKALITAIQFSKK